MEQYPYECYNEFDAGRGIHRSIEQTGDNEGRADRLEEIKEKIADGYYDRPDVKEKLAEKLIEKTMPVAEDSGVIGDRTVCMNLALEVYNKYNIE